MEGRPLHNTSRTRKSMGHLNFNSNIDIGTNTLPMLWISILTTSRNNKDKATVMKVIDMRVGI